MFKKKIDTATLFASKRTDASIDTQCTRTFMTLNGSDNYYAPIDELSEEMLDLPADDAFWLDMLLFGSREQIITVAHSFKLSPATQNALENKKQPPRLFRDGINRILICRQLHLDKNSEAVYHNVCFAAGANRLLSLQHSRIDKLKQARILVSTLQQPNNNIPHALTIILGKILDDNCEVINFLEDRLQSISAAYADQDEAPDAKELLRLRRSLIVAKQAIYPMRRVINRAQRQDPPLLISQENSPDFLSLKLDNAVLALSVADELLTSLETLSLKTAAEHSADCQSTLTTTAAVFLPLICISSIFAMNFENMPELKSQWGYSICLGFMALVAMFTLKKLQRKKWY